MDLSPDELAVLSAIVHGPDAKAPVGLLMACHGPAMASMDAKGLIVARTPCRPEERPEPRGLIEVWPADEPQPTATLTPLAAQWLGVALAERETLRMVEVWRSNEETGAGADWGREERLVISSYWARRHLPSLPVDDPVFGDVPPMPTRVRQPSRPGEYPDPFPDLIPGCRPTSDGAGPDMGLLSKKAAKKSKAEKADRDRKKRAG